MYEVVIGSETDNALVERIQAVVSRLHGGISNPEWTIGGSQEIATYKISLPSGNLEVVTETYIGVTLRGPEALVLDFANQVTKPT